MRQHCPTITSFAALLGLALSAGCSKSSEVPPAGAPAEALPAPSTAPAEPAQQGLPASEPAPPPAPVQAPKSNALDDFTTLEDAEKALAQAKSELDRLALAPAHGAGRDEAEHKPDKKARSAPAPAGAGVGAASAEAAGGSTCDNVCRAFSSLTRAASAVCRIDGDSGAHCAHAKQVRADAERRVASCSCS